MKNIALSTVHRLNKWRHQVDRPHTYFIVFTLTHHLPTHIHKWNFFFKLLFVRFEIMTETFSWDGLDNTDSHSGRFEYNAGSSRPYRCVFCDRCYKYRNCLDKHFRELHLNVFVLCGQQAIAKQMRVKDAQMRPMSQAEYDAKPVQVSVIVQNKKSAVN